MIHKHFCVVDTKGFYSDFVVVESQTGKFDDPIIVGYTLKEGERLLDAAYPMGFLSARWDGIQWLEGATPEEMELHEKQREQELQDQNAFSGSPSLEDRVTATENALLTLILGGASNA